MSWKSLFPTSTVKTLWVAHSDHSPLLLRLENKTPLVGERRKRVFRFELLWVRKEECHMNKDGHRDEKLQVPITSVRTRIIKGKDDQIDQGLMIAIEETIKEGLKFKNEGLEDDGNPHRLLMIQCLNLKKEYSTWIQEVLRLARGCLRMESIQFLLKAKDLRKA
ncbi:hypothetical protein M9H77_23323 [Catharanthus roseus]|uniref:Uncharacterized protein n=1 Tax=Catharanthus roseus TaxID=4058 RepID=A0ACC0ASZ5_CATRO|nr:hypothetical protein M9H77_23323 [Catharanthus roseus]